MAVCAGISRAAVIVATENGRGCAYTFFMCVSAQANTMNDDPRRVARALLCMREGAHDVE